MGLLWDAGEKLDGACGSGVAPGMIPKGDAPAGAPTPICGAGMANPGAAPGMGDADSGIILKGDGAGLAIACCKAGGADA
jgi:hypothetical protein